MASNGSAIVLTATWTANATDAYSYAAGTGTGTAPTAGSGLDGTSITLAANTFTEPGYTFAGWTDGSATYAAGSSYTLASNGSAIVLTATWTVDASYTVTFDGNGSDGGAMAPQTEHTPSALSTNAYSRTDYAFAGWNSAAYGSGTAYADGATDPFSANQTLFAQWTVDASYTVTFDGNGSDGGAMAPQTEHTPSALSANAYSRTGYAFAGWNSAADGSGTTYADGASDPFGANQTLFAQWTVDALNPPAPIAPPRSERL